MKPCPSSLDSDTHALRHGCALILLCAAQMFSKTAAAKGQDASYKKARAVAIGCVMLKVRSGATTCLCVHPFARTGSAALHFCTRAHAHGKGHLALLPSTSTAQLACQQGTLSRAQRRFNQIWPLLAQGVLDRLLSNWRSYQVLARLLKFPFPQKKATSSGLLKGIQASRYTRACLAPHRAHTTHSSLPIHALAFICFPQTYFRLSTITNCKNVIQTIDNVLKVFDQAEAAHRVTYR
eukprot:1142774-Pelagomonas_calceolata.AAC.1